MRLADAATAGSTRATQPPPRPQRWRLQRPAPAASAGPAPFAVYGGDFARDDSDAKWCDASGNRLHGWAPGVGTRRRRRQTDGHVERYFDCDGTSAAAACAVLPVPLDWDARAGAIDVGIRLDVARLPRRTEVPLLKISVGAEQGSVALQLVLAAADAGRCEAAGDCYMSPRSEPSYIQFVWDMAGGTRAKQPSGPEDEYLSFPVE